MAEQIGVAISLEKLHKEIASPPYFFRKFLRAARKHVTGLAIEELINPGFASINLSTPNLNHLSMLPLLSYSRL